MASDGGYISPRQKQDGHVETRPSWLKSRKKESLRVSVRVGMMCKLFLFFALLLTIVEPLLGHPLIHSAEMTYTRPVLVEEEQMVSPEDLSYSEQAYLSQGSVGFGYPSLITGDISSDGLRTAGFVPSKAAKEVLLEKPLLSRFLGSRKQYRKRGSNTECFWKYCV